MSIYPKHETQPKKAWTTPKITKIDPGSGPYADVIDILRSTLKQAEKDVSLNPNDANAVELQRSLQQMLDDLGRKKGTIAA